MARVYDFTKKRMVDDDDDRYEVKKRGDGSMSIVRNSFASPRTAETWRSDPAFSQAKAAIKSGKIAEFNSSQVRAGAQSAPAPAAKKPILPAALPNRADMIGVRKKQPILPAPLPKQRAQDTSTVPARPIQKGQGLLAKYFPSPYDQKREQAAAAASGAEQKGQGLLGRYIKQEMQQANAKKPIDWNAVNKKTDAFVRAPGEGFIAKTDKFLTGIENVLIQSAYDGFQNTGDKARELFANRLARVEKKYGKESSQYQSALDALQKSNEIYAKERPALLQTTSWVDQAEATRQKALDGLQGGGRFAGEAALMTGDMAIDLAMSAVTGVPFLAMQGGLSGGGAAQDALESGKDTETAVLYGLGTGASSALIESMGGVGGKLGGKFFSSKPVQELAKKLPPKMMEKVVALAGSKLGQIATTSLSEGTEEFAQYSVQHVLDSLLMDKETPWDVKEALYNAGAGAVMGGAFGAFGQIKAAQKNGQLGKYLDPDNITDADIEAYLKQVHANDTAKNEINIIPTRNEAKGMLATDPNNMKRYQMEVDGAFSGTLPGGTDILVGKTPDVLVKHGAPDVSLHIGQATARKIAYPTGYLGLQHGHNLGMSALKNLPYQLENPVAILKNPQPNAKNLQSLVILTEWYDDEGLRIVTPVHLNAQGALEIQNNVASTFGADYLDVLLGTNNENVIYTKNNEDIKQLLSTGVNSPKAMADDILARNNIPQKYKDINGQKIGSYGNIDMNNMIFDPITAPLHVAEQSKAANEAREQGMLDTFLAPGKAKTAKENGDDVEHIARVLTQTPHTSQTPKERIGKAYDYLNRKIVDSGYTIATIGKITKDDTLYHLYNSAKQSRAQANYAIGGQGVTGHVGAQTDINGRAVGESLFDIFEPVKKKGEEYYKAFNEYLYHQHNIDRMNLEERGAQRLVDEIARDIGQLEMEHPFLQGLDEGEIARFAHTDNPHREAAKKWLEITSRENKAVNKPVFGWSVTALDSAGMVKALETQYPEFQKLAQKVWKYGRNLMDYRVQAGLVSPEQAAMLGEMYPHYVPTMRIMEPQGARGKAGGGVLIQKGIKKAEGSAKDLLPVMDAMASQTAQTYGAGRRNLFGNRLLGDTLANQDKMGQYVYSVKEIEGAFDPDQPMQDTAGKFVLYENGKAMEMELNPGVFEGVNALMPQEKESNPVARGVTELNNTFKKLVTGYNPTFLASNFFRDIQDAGLFSKDFKAFAAAYLPAWEEMTHNGELWRQYQALGGFGSSFLDYEKGLKQDRGKLGRFSIDAIENVNMMVEQAPRFAEFMATVKKGGDSPENLMRAMYNAADVTVNFGRSGTWGKTLNSTFVPFFNPGIQGASKMIRRFTETEGVKEWTGLVIKCAVLGVALPLLNSMLLENDEGYQMIPQREKDTNYLFKMPGGIFAKIPKGRVLSLLGMSADAAVRTFRGLPTEWAGFIDTAVSQVVPTNPLTGNLFSQAINTRLFESDQAGETWYGSPIENTRLQNIADPTKRYDEKTDNFSIWLGEKTGLSPKKINYLLDSYTGAIGDFALPLLTPRAEQNPFVKKFLIDPVLTNDLSDQFYTESERISLAKQAEDGKDYNDLTARYLNKINGDVGDLYEEIRKIESSDLSDKEKQAKVYPLKQQINKLQKDTLDTVQKYESAARESWIGDTDKEIDRAYFKTNQSVFGGEYALKTYNKKAYERAVALNRQGVDFDTFAELYMMHQELEKSEGESVSTKFREELLGSALPLDKKEIIYKDFISDSDSTTKKIDSFKGAGLDVDDFFTAANEYARIDEAGGNAQDKATAFYHWLDTQNLSKQEYDTVADSMKYFQMFPAEPKAYRPDQMGKQGQEGYALMKEKYGMPEDIFMEYSEVAAGIEGTKDSNGKTISGSQKKGRFQALVQMEMGKGASREQAEANARAFLMGVYGYKDGGWR